MYHAKASHAQIWSRAVLRAHEDADFFKRIKISVHYANRGNAGLRQYVSHLRFAQTRRVVFKGEMFFLLVHAKASQAISVGKFAEAFELFEAQGRLQFESDFKEGHPQEYSRHFKE